LGEVGDYVDILKRDLQICLDVINELRQMIIDERNKQGQLQAQCHEFESECAHKIEEIANLESKVEELETKMNENDLSFDY